MFFPDGLSAASWCELPLRVTDVGTSLASESMFLVIWELAISPHVIHQNDYLKENSRLRNPGLRNPGSLICSQF